MAPTQLPRSTAEHYNYFRDFNPATGRYIQSDPIGLAGGLSTYSYVDGSPLTKDDFFGLMGRGSMGQGPGYWGKGGPGPAMCLTKCLREFRDACDYNKRSGRWLCDKKWHTYADVYPDCIRVADEIDKKCDSGFFQQKCLEKCYPQPCN